MYFSVGKKFKCTKSLGFIEKDEVIECLQVSSCQPVYIIRIKRFRNEIYNLDIFEFESLLKLGIFVLIGSINKKVNLRKKGFKTFVKTEKRIIKNLKN